jgi:hypothetical protein
MVSALLMFRRLAHALRYAVREEDFVTVFGASVTLVLIGTVSYALGEGWNVLDAFYFAVATLTTTSVSDPDLVLDERWMKVFTVFYLLIGIGILVEILRRLGIAFVTVRAQERNRKGRGEGLRSREARARRGGAGVTARQIAFSSVPRDGHVSIARRSLHATR